MNDVTVKQNDIIIALLARAFVGIDFIYDTVAKGKKDPASYIKAYNALDGTLGVTDAAKLANVSQPRMTGVLQTWEAAGIIYDLANDRRPLYRRLLVLPQRRPSSEAKE